MQKAIRFLLSLLVFSQLAQAQTDSASKILADFRSGPYLDKVGSQATGLSNQITERSEKYLRGIAAEESRLQTKLSKTNPEAGPHVNFETFKPNPLKPGKLKVEKNFHVYLND